MEITKEMSDALVAAFNSDALKLVKGVGSAETAGEGTACTISEINLVLTGNLTDDLHPCMSPVIRSWVISIQDRMPDSVRNSTKWRNAAVGIAGTAGSQELEKKRLTLIKEWAITFDAAAYAADAVDAYAVDAYAADAAAAYAYAAADAAAAYAYAAYAADAVDAADAADAAYAAAAWEKLDPAGLLIKLINTTEEM